MAKFLILGGTGAIGKYVVNELADTDHEIFVSSRKKRDNFKNIHYLQGDAKNSKFINELCQDSYDCIVDFMVWSTEEFKNICPLLLKHTGHYIFLSSYRVYANADMTPLTEDYPLLLDVSNDKQYLATDEYALAKARCERLLQNSNYKNYTILRPAITFSTARFQLCTLEADLILPRSVKRQPLLLAKEMMDKRAAVSWAGMAGKMIVPLLLRDEAKCEIFNIGTMESHTWKTIAGYYHDLIGADYILVDINEYLNLGFPRYQAIYDRLFNRIINNHKVINFLDKFSQTIEIPSLLSSLKHEISLNKSMNIATSENFRIGNNMNKFILDNTDRINLVYGDHFQLLSIAQNIQNSLNEELDINSLIKSSQEFINKRDFAQALKKCETIRELFPQNVEGYLKAHDAFRQIKEFDKAEDIVAQGMKLIPNEHSLWFASYDLAFARKDYSKALSRALEMSHNFPKLVSGFVRAAKACMELGELDQAELYCNQGFKLDPENIEIWLTYPEIPMRKGDNKRALEIWARFRQLFPARHEGYTRAGVACFRLGELDLALQYCREYLSSHPVHIDPLFVSFDVAMRKKDFALALEISLKIQKSFPNLCSGYFRAASAYMALEEYDKAEEAGRRAVELAPDAPVTWLVYSDIPMRQGNFELALERFAEIRTRFPHELAGYTRAAQACKKLGDFKKAREICDKGMKIGDKAFEILSYTIAEIMAQAPENYFCSIDYLNGLFEKSAGARSSTNFYQQLYHCGLLLAHKFNCEEGSNYFNLILKLFLSDPCGKNSSRWLLTYLSRCNKSNDECRNRIDQIIEENQIFTDFSTLIYSKSTIVQKNEAICNILRLKNNICVYHFLCFTRDHMDYKKIISEIISDKNLLASFSDYGLYILLHLFEFLDMEKTETYANLLLELKDEKSDIYPFLQYRRFHSQLLRTYRPVKQHGKRLRVAVCVSGQLRGYKEAFENWYKILNLEAHDITYFIHTWKNIGRKLPYEHMFYPRAFKGEFLKAYQKLDMPLDDIRRYYKNFYALLLGNAEIERNDLVDFYNTENIIIEDENDPKFINFNNMQKMHYKIYACNEFLHQPIQNFDLVIRIRPDFFMTPRGDINLRQIYDDSLANNVIYTDDKHAAFWTHEMVIGDCLAIGTPPLMDIYARTYLDHYKFKNIKHFMHRDFLLQHLSISYQLLTHGIGMKAIPVRIGALDPTPLPVKDIYEALQKDISAHPKRTYEDQIFLNACERDLDSMAN